MSDKVRINRVRRVAGRQGLRLHKSRTRDPQALDFGRYWLLDAEDPSRTIYGRHYGKDLSDVEAWLAPRPEEDPDLAFVFENRDEHDVMVAVDLLRGLAQETGDDLYERAMEGLQAAWARKLDEDEERRIEAMTDEEFEAYQRGETD